MKNGLTMNASQILCVLARLLINRQKQISGVKRQKRRRLVKWQKGRSAPGNGGELMILWGHQLRRH